MRSNLLSVLLPALLPSWRFFDDVGPSPRLEVALLQYASDAPQQWLPFPAVESHLSAARLLGRLCWNPRRNEALFVLSCCERVLQQTSRVAEAEIVNRINAALLQGELAPMGLAAARCFVFRIRLVARDGEELFWRDAFLSAPQPLSPPLLQKLLQQSLQLSSQQRPGDNA